MSDLYAGLKRSSRKKGESRDCGVISFAAITGLSYDDAHLWLEMIGRRPKDGTLHYQVLQSYQDYGIKLLDQRKLWAKCKTPISLVKHGPKTGRYMVCTRTHVFAFIDGIVHDWVNGRRHRITDIFKVLDRAIRQGDKNNCQ